MSRKATLDNPAAQFAPGSVSTVTLPPRSTAEPAAHAPEPNRAERRARRRRSTTAASAVRAPEFAPRALGDTITIQLLEGVVGVGNSGDIVTVTETTAIELIESRGWAVPYTGGPGSPLYQWLSSAPQTLTTTERMQVATNLGISGFGIDQTARDAGMHVQSFGIATGAGPNSASATQNAADFDLIRRLGADSIRIDLDWFTIGTGGQGVYDWTVPDGVFDAADAAGLRVVFMPVNSPSWSRTAGEASKLYPPTNVATFAAFCTAAVARYKNRGSFGCHAWEIWNEPNNSSHWADPTNVAGYVALLRAAYTAIKAADSTSVVLLGSLLRGGEEDWTVSNLDTTWLSYFYAAGGKGTFDVLGYHPYSQSYDPAALTPTGQATGSEFITNGTFDTDTSGWSGTSATVARVTSPVQSGAGALSLTAAGGAAAQAVSSTFTGIVGGQTYLTQAWVRAATVGESMEMVVNWRDSSGSYVSTSLGHPVTDNVNGWTLITGRVTAPASGVARANVQVQTVGTSAAGTVHYVDGITFKAADGATEHGWNRLPLVRAVMIANGDGGKPIWATESGQHTGTAAKAVDENTQAIYLSNALSRLRDYPYVTRVWWYTARDSGTDTTQEQQNYGLVHNDGVTFKAAATVYKNRGLHRAPVLPQSGQLANPVVLVGGTTSTLFTVTLPVGTWLLSYGAAFTLVSQFSEPQIAVVGGPAVGSISGRSAADMKVGSATNTPRTSGHVECIITVTTEGTVLLQAQSPNNDTAVATTGTAGFTGATGYTAIRVTT